MTKKKLDCIDEEKIKEYKDKIDRSKFDTFEVVYMDGITNKIIGYELYKRRKVKKV